MVASYLDVIPGLVFSTDIYIYILEIEQEMPGWIVNHVLNT